MFTTFNSITISGVINRNPEYKENKQDSSKTVLHYNVVCYLPHVYQNEKGQKKQEKLFFGCNSYGREAVRLASLLKKGSYVMVSGNIRPNFYIADNGMYVFALNIDANSCLPIDIARNQGNSQQNTQNKSQDQQNNRQNPNGSQSDNTQRSQSTETNTSMPPRRRATMPGVSQTRSHQSVDSSYQNNRQKNDQSTRNHSTVNNSSEQRPRSNNDSTNEFSNLKPEENPFNMSGQNTFENPYGDGTLPTPDGFMNNGNY